MSRAHAFLGRSFGVVQSFPTVGSNRTFSAKDQGLAAVQALFFASILRPAVKSSVKMGDRLANRAQTKSQAPRV